MIPGSFAYHRPSSVKEAVSLLGSLGDDARAIAGGHSLIPMMKLRLASPSHLIDLAGVADLKGKKIVVGQKGGSTERAARLILEAHGVPWDAVS